MTTRYYAIILNTVFTLLNVIFIVPMCTLIRYPKSRLKWEIIHNSKWNLIVIYLAGYIYQVHKGRLLTGLVFFLFACTY